MKKGRLIKFGKMISFGDIVNNANISVGVYDESTGEWNRTFVRANELIKEIKNNSGSIACKDEEITLTIR